MINIPKGTKDMLPKDSFKWQYTNNGETKDLVLYITDLIIIHMRFFSSVKIDIYIAKNDFLC